jgi:hypothetical protein
MTPGDEPVSPTPSTQLTIPVRQPGASASAREAVNVASPHLVGGNVLTNPTEGRLSARGRTCPARLEPGLEAGVTAKVFPLSPKKHEGPSE